MKNWLLCLAGLLALSPAVLGQDSAERRKLDNSLSWGVDRDTGKIAVDAFLLYFYDPVNQVLVVNGAAVKYAASDAGAEIQPDGSWRMSDGATLKPIIAEAAIFLGDEPEELREVMRGFPETRLDRVQLSSGEASAKAERSRWFKRCNRCTSCIGGCWGQELFQGGDFKTCGSGGIFNSCKETGREDYCTPTLRFSCDGCSGSLLSTTNYYNWGCALDC